MQNSQEELAMALIKEIIETEPVKAEVTTSKTEKPKLDEKVVEVLDEIVSTIIEPKSSKSTGTKKTTPKKNSKKKYSSK